MSQIWKINGLEFELDMSDADTLEKYNEAFEKLQVKEKSLLKIGKQTDIIREYCKMFYELFDHLFGAGTGEKLFNGKHSARLCEEVYEKFIDFARDQVKEVNQNRNRIANKYTPQKSQPYYQGKNKHRG